MLTPYQPEPLDAIDEEVFAALVPEDHYLRRVKAAIDFNRFRETIGEAYCQHVGRPAIEPVLMFKLEFLQYHYNLADRRVMEQAQVNVAYRFFLDLGRKSELPHHTGMTNFRDRLGVERHQQLFDQLIAQGREHGLVKDRLRVQDATHIIANIAVPSTLRLVAETRDRLLAALEPLAPERAAKEQQRAETLHTVTADLEDAERLLHRVTHLREVVLWAETVLAGPEAAAAPEAQQALQQALELAHKVLDDRNEPTPQSKKDHVVSVHDPEARRGKHGEFYTGYLLDVSMDADSELITQVNVLPANGDEAADAEPLIAKEEAAHGNDVEMLSMDAAGFRGEPLRDLTNPQRLGLKVIVPPQPEPKPTGFPADQFVLEESGERLRCPGGQTTGMRKRSRLNTGWQFHFSRATCAGCPLQTQCVPQLPNTRGRTVTKKDYEAEYRAARALVGTPEYTATRREHPRVERKLAEIVRWHGGRRARYRGSDRALLQALLTTVVVNVKRMMHLLAANASAAEEMVRAELSPGTG